MGEKGSLTDKFPCNPSSSGFTLLEVVIAVAVIAVGFTAVFSLNSRSVSAGRSIDFYTRAPLLAAEKLSEIENKPEMVNDASGDFGDQHAGYSWNASTDEVESERLGEFAGRLKKIDLVITLNDGEQTYSMTAYRYFKGEKNP